MIRVAALHTLPLVTIVACLSLAVETGAQMPVERASAASADQGIAGCATSASEAEPELTRRATQLLTEHGFANVAAVAEGGCLLVTYENARFRDERRALRKAAALIAPLLDADRQLVLVPTHRAIPLVTARLASAADQAPADSTETSNPTISLDVSRLPAALLDAPRASSSFGRVDVVVHPWFEASFGAYDNPVASRTAVAPELRMDVRPGLSVSAQALLTLQDDLHTGESRVRPGWVTVNQTVRLPRNVFVSATAGTFNPNRYGADLEARAYFANGRLSAGTQMGLTGAASYARTGWQRSPMRDETALVDVTWRVLPYDLLLRATAGAFLADERGVRLDVSRRFGELEIGWFLLASDDGQNGGLVLRIPLLPRTYGRPAPLRLRSTETYRWQYRYYGFVPGGWRYDTGRALRGPVPAIDVLSNPARHR
jgi:hypothetical protein